LAAFLVEAQQLRARLDETPLPIGQHNAWVDRVDNYLRANLSKGYEVKFSDFSGMTFYGNDSERSKPPWLGDCCELGQWKKIRAVATFNNRFRSFLIFRLGKFHTDFHDFLMRDV
jgi:hypothetical protein